MNKRSFTQSLRGKLTLRMLAVGLVPLIVLGFTMLGVIYNLGSDVARAADEARKTMEVDVVGPNLTRAARDVTDRIDTYLYERMQDTLVWASAPAVVDAAAKGKTMAEEQGLVGLSEDAVESKMERTKTLNASPTATQYIKDQMQKSGAFKEIFFTEEHGFNVALTGPTSDFLQKGEEWWDVAWEKGIHVGDVEYNESAGIYSINISVRIDDPTTGKALGVMNAVLDIGAVQAIASEKAAEIEDSEVMIFKSDGLLLADTASGHDPGIIMSEDHNLVKEGYRPATLALGTTFFRAAGTESSFSLEEVIGYSASGGSDFYDDIPGFGGFNWAATVQQPRATAFAPLKGVSFLEQELGSVRTFAGTLAGSLIVLMALLSTIATALLALYLARGITRPLVHVSDVANKVSRGDLDMPIEITSKDEIGELAESIERMRASLKAAIERLRAR